MENTRLTYADVENAYKKISSYVNETPLEKSVYLSNDTKNVYLKLECMQPVKAFKIRGAYNKILSLSDEEKSMGMAAVSSGNHGIAVSYVSKMLGLKPAKIIVPNNTPKSKIDKIKFFGGDVVLMGNCFDEANSLGMEYIKDKGYYFVDGWDNDEKIYAGQGTCAYEIFKQNPDIDTVLVPIGGGSLMTSTAVVAKHINPDIKVIGLYSESCPAWAASVKENKLYYEYPSEESVCEAMVGGIGHLSYSLRGYVDDALMVKEDIIKEAMIHAILNEKIVAEAAGAVPIGAMMQYGDRIPGKNIALIISGGNADSDLIVKQIKKMK